MRTLCTTLAVVFCVVSPTVVSAETIRSMEVGIELSTDRSARITETIVYDFGDDQRHGIFRDIPRESGGMFTQRTVDSETITVTDETSSSVPFDVSDNGDYRRVKIGDPDVEVTGVHTYVISYDVQHVIGYFEQFDEFYWNATGNAWRVAIERARVHVKTPREPLQSACYEGPYGSSDPCAGIERVADGVVFSSSVLNPAEGLTVAVGFAKGVMVQPTGRERLIGSMLTYAPAAVPIFALVLLYKLWRWRGRDERGRGTIMPEYEPPSGYSPSLVSYLSRGGGRSSDIAAEILYLAVHGYLKITRTEEKTLGVFTSNDYVFDKVKDADSKLEAHQSRLLTDLFASGDSVELSKLSSEHSLQDTYAALSKHVTDRVKAEKFYITMPWVAIPLAILAILVLVGAGVFFAAGHIVGMVSMIATAGITMFFAFIMPARTRKGSLTHESILGFKYYLEKAEKARLDFHNAPERTPERFEQLLPYALALGVSAAWAKEFEGITKEPPKWYSDSTHAVFLPTVFASDMNTMSASAISAASSPSSSSGSGGGGFSGGGGGGGGGGSW